MVLKENVLIFRQYTTNYLTAKGDCLQLTFQWFGKHAYEEKETKEETKRMTEQMGQPQVICESEKRLLESSLYYSCNFSVSLKL